MEEGARREPDGSSQVMLPLLPQDANQQSHRSTNFYIDDILRPDFGRKGRDGTPVSGASGPGAAGKKPPRAGSRQQGGAGSGGQQPERRRPEPAAGRRAGPGSGSGPAAKPMLWPAWVYCTRYSDRPSSGPRSRRAKKEPTPSKEDKRPRTAFTAEQLHRLKAEFQDNRYLTEQRRQGLARDLGLSESQIKIWFQNKRAKIKKTSGSKNVLAAHLMAQGLYDHSTARDAKSDSD